MKKANLLQKDLKTLEQDLLGRETFLVTRFTTKGVFLTTIHGYDHWEGEWYPFSRIKFLD